MNQLLDKKLFEMTGGEWIELMKMTTQTLENKIDYTQEEYLHGISGLAEFLKLSKSTVQNMLNAGKFDSAKRNKSARKLMFLKKEVTRIIREIENN